MSFNPTLSRLLRSELGAVHRSRNPQLKAALQDLPEYRTALKHLTAAAAIEPPAVRQFDYTDAGRRLVASLKAGDDVPPPELVDELAQHEAERQANEGIGHVITAAQQLLTSELDGAINVTKLCGILTKRLEDVVGQARALKSVPASADAAIASDAVDEWRALSGIATTYAELREAQALIWATFSNRGAQLDGTRMTRPSVTGKAAAAWLRNPQDIVDLDDRPQVGEVGFSTHQVWPTDFNHADAVWWFREHGEAQPWCPSPEQFHKAVEALQVELHSNQTPEQRKAAREAQRHIDKALHHTKQGAGR